SGINPRFTNMGLIEADGDLTVEQSGTDPVFANAGTINVLAGRRLTVNHGTFQHTAGNVSGMGSLVFSFVTANFMTSFSADTLGMSLTSTTLNGPGPVMSGSGGRPLPSAP